MISISLVSYNSLSVTLDAISSALYWLNQSGLQYEFIVIDNASSEKNAEIIRTRYPSVTVIELSENIGFARAHNVAINYSKGEIIVIMNSDIIVVNNVFSNIARLFKEDPDLSAIGPLTEDLSGIPSPTSREKIFYSLFSTGLSVFNSIFPIIARDKAASIPSLLRKTVFSAHESVFPSYRSREVEWVDGMFVAFSRRHLELVGLFDSFYFFDHEIGDLMLRLSEVNGKIYYDSNSRVKHLGGYSRKKNPKIIHASLIGYIHYLYNNRRHYFLYVSVEIVALAFAKILLSWFYRKPKDVKLWKKILLDTFHYMKYPVESRFTIRKLDGDKNESI